MNTHKLCILLNGPAGVGKDTLADRLVPYGFEKHAFKACLYKKTAEYFLISEELLTARAQDRILKEKPWGLTELKGKVISPREALIHVSERIIKPEFGDSYFGDAAVATCVSNSTELAVFSDSGFDAEVFPLQELFDTLLIIRLHRDGFTFEGDSRNYLVGFEYMADLQLEENGEEQAIASLIQIIVDQSGEKLSLTL